MFLNFFKKIFSSNKVRVRIAPSPTGYLHIGTARTALFNWLYVKKLGGKFILRIEDTDLERSEKKYEEDIIEGLKWLGLDWDEGPFKQSDRIDIYEKYIRKMLDEDRAYFCNCSKEELDAERKAQMDRGESPKYSGRCRDKNISEKDAQLIRYKNHGGEIIFKDLIRDEIKFDSSLIGDIAIAKNLKTPLYNFAVVVDDHEMNITHVIRGEDHIANTPKQILIQQALGFRSPKYGHMPLILNPDKSKMSKRFAATSIKEYRDQGYLADAMINFISFLGWHPIDDKDKMTRKEIIKEFDLDRMQKGGAVFDIQKLNWLNSQYLKEKSNKDLLKLFEDFYNREFSNYEKKIVEVSKDRIEKLSDFEELKKSFDLSEYEKELLKWKKSDLNSAKENLRRVKELLKTLLDHEYNLKNLEIKIMGYADENGRGDSLWPLRVALSGKQKSPSPIELLYVLDKNESIDRIEKAIKKLDG
ncbi:glutamate--tRNA ligase [Candidatus Wolfebacteria bacterium]|nr:glutamate--tRNA ligase [Candidatus Wolfebacteria bacterium]